ncbi:MAG: glutamate-1-semialdehyde 2,1-aminomutase [Oligoflexales bacterium]
MVQKSRSHSLFVAAKKHMPGGVSSPVRAFGAVGGEPLFLSKAKGSYIWDVDDNRYIDFVGSWGPAILGHAHDDVVEEIIKVAREGLSFGAPTEAETLLAQEISKAMPQLEKVRFVSSGTEACMSAVRLARAYTNRDKLLKFEGNYHGHADSLLAKAGSGLATFGISTTPGVTQACAKDTLTVPYNDLEAVAETFSKNANEIAAVIVEPLAGNCGFVRPLPGFLKELKAQCVQNGSLLIIDEVMTGFRVARGGMQSIESVEGDLTTLGKVIGGGMPLAAYGGRQEIMDRIAPLGDVYQAGTLSGNPLATACGLKTLEILSKPGVYNQLGNLTHKLVNGLIELGKQCDIPIFADCEGGMFGMFFADGRVENFAAAQASQTSIFSHYFNKMLEKGVYLAPSAYEAGFVSTAHSEQDIEQTLHAARESLMEIKQEQLHLSNK